MDLRLSDILDPSCIRIGLEANDKTQALSGLVDVLANSTRVRDLAEVRRVIMERERLMSTGIGHGIALPHGKTSGVDSSVAAFAILKSPIDFDSIDDKPVSIMLMLVGTEGNVGMHLRLLSRISRMIGSEAFRSSLLAAKSSEEVMELFASHEEERA